MKCHHRLDHIPPTKETAGNARCANCRVEVFPHDREKKNMLWLLVE